MKLAIPLNMWNRTAIPQICKTKDIDKPKIIIIIFTFQRGIIIKNWQVCTCETDKIDENISSDWKEYIAENSVTATSPQILLWTLNGTWKEFLVYNYQVSWNS